MTSPQRTPTFLGTIREYYPRVMRLSFYLMFLSAAFGGVALLRAKAHVSELLLSMGEEVLRYDAALHQDEPRALLLNGERMYIRSGLAPHPIGRVLDYYEGWCKKRDGQFEDQLREALGGKKLGEPPGFDRSLFDGTIRVEDGPRGFVVCLDFGGERVTPSDVLARFQRFQRSMDLADLGHLRYVYARESEDTTHFVGFWTQDSFSLRRVFPAEGDAPGKDLPNVPRPQGSRRVLSAMEEGQPYGFTLYTESNDGPPALERFYRSRLPKLGWKLVEVGDPVDANAIRAHLHGLPPSLTFDRKGQRIVLFFQKDENGKGSATMLTSP